MPQRSARDIQPSGAFTFCRIQYDSGDRGRRSRWGGWRTDYPESDLNFSLRLSQLTTLENNQLNRDVPVVVRYGDWAEADGLSFPGSLSVTVNGSEVHTQERTSYQVNPSLDADTFSLSAGAEGSTASAAEHAAALIS